MLPEEYINIPEDELKSRIKKAKFRLGRELVILGHHYQREEVIQFADFKGDSFGLSKMACEQKSAKYIVFCGVHFMAEAARILAKPDQRVFVPDMKAGCPMADMASIDEVEEAWKTLGESVNIKKVIPITYMNSSADLKAFCGRNGGAVCTSSNAEKVFEWAFGQGEKIFFFPDEHLGRNTANKLGIKHDEAVLYNSINAPTHQRTNVLLWNGFCHVHTHFTQEHIRNARKEYKGCKIIVHPECREDVVSMSDASGSTDAICRFVINAPKGSTIVVGTEINLVNRLASENPDRKIVPLARSLCPNMFRVSLNNLCFVLENLVEEEFVNEVKVDEAVANDARSALQCMLNVT